ncbi:MAG: bifunctional pyr operon transcriptional regulator/uracil phosphoribosyltransferase PyrR [Bacteroidia bacterium]|nr:bifunctional pyr operon transcriptional regulator/uracil phosphoribosyltransferase PyrR [Bacteroidia bacterium]MCC7532825.1 bifunctional pyr operon transcriptional regulator/uracil phosphoribosyltransferase PyrR [Bacteroidia bacterium]MCZ2140020.1 bifunctional pyr operon transcriptional regulator/uracil phosphoribosyltransferase PyrR [Bacteroidia bacterium]
MNARTILEKKQLDITIDRLCFELIEKHGDFSNTAIIGLQPRGIFLSRKIHQRIAEITKSTNILYGELDISFYRDDFRRGNEQIIPSEMNINFTVQDKNIVIIDDVLYTGRSIRSALDALTDFGRPKTVELLVLVDRRYSRHLPIQPDYTGIAVDTRANDKVKVEWKENAKNDNVHIITNQS